MRAYTKALQEGLAASKIATLSYGVRVRIETDYTGVGKLQYILGKAGIQIEDTQFYDKVVFQVFLLWEEKERIYKDIVEATAGKCSIEEKESLYAPVVRA